MNSGERLGWCQPDISESREVFTGVVLKGTDKLEDVSSQSGRVERNSSRSFETRGSVAIASLFLLLVAAACSRSEASVKSTHEESLPTVPVVSQLADAAVVRREDPPPLLVDNPEALRLPEGLPLPEGIRVVVGSCASDGHCQSYNFYWAPTHEAVVLPREGRIKVLHEFCHGYQHKSINGGLPLPPSDYDLESWYQTEEGLSFTRAVYGLPWPWDQSKVNSLEDFAWTCAYWYDDPPALRELSPERYQWAAENLPK